MGLRDVLIMLVQTRLFSFSRLDSSYHRVRSVGISSRYLSLIKAVVLKRETVHWHARCCTVFPPHVFNQYFENIFQMAIVLHIHSLSVPQNLPECV